jgi:hypothetical protein
MVDFEYVIVGAGAAGDSGGSSRFQAGASLDRGGTSP